MPSHDSHCDIIQQSIAIGEMLTSSQKIHVDNCPQCRALQSEFNQLNQLVEQSIEEAVPDGFADRVMAKLPSSPQSVPTNLFGSKLLDLFGHSRLLQATWVGLGIALGVGHIVRFFLGVFITSIAAAL